MNYRKILNKLLYPPTWLIVLLVPVCTVALILTFVWKQEMHPLAYVTYVLSFYTLSVVVIRCIRSAPRRYITVKKAIYSNPVGERLMTDKPFRTSVNLYSSLVINMLYVALNIVLGVLYHTAWFYVLAFYYTILAVMRFLLVRFVRQIGIGKNYLKELRNSRLCGGILLTVNLALSGAVLMILYQNKGYEYNGILIYVMAMYTFYITTIAIINLFKYKKLGSPVMSMSKVINMAAALVSMLALETAMLSQFGSDMSTVERRIMVAATGAGVSIIVVAMSIYSIVKCTKEINKIKKKLSLKKSNN